MKLREKLRNIQKEHAAYHEKAHTLTSPQIQEERMKFKALRLEIAELITEGCIPDPEDGKMPHGMFHDGSAKAFEIGSLTIRGHRVRGALPEDAVEDWNAGKWLPPREPGTVIATHADATGKIISQKTLKAQVPQK
jgi:hypothetical protein